MAQPAQDADDHMHLAMVHPTRFTTYAQFYSDDAQDPYRANYAAVLNRFDPTNNIPQALIMEQVLGATNAPQCFLAAFYTTIGYRIFMLHRPARFTARLDGVQTQWDNRIFAYRGDIMFNTMSIVEFPEDAFETTPPVQIWNVARLTEEFAANRELELVWPQDGDNDRTREVATRKVMYTPARYARLFLSERGYSPREVWNTLIPVLEQDGNLKLAEY